MEIVDISPDLEEKCFNCLADEKSEWSIGVKRKEAWYRKMVKKGLRVKMAKDENGQVGGMIQYGPAENSFPGVKELFFVYCIWVKRDKKKKNFQKKGMGTALLQAAEADVKAKEAKGLVVWGIKFPFWMKASWFKKKGYHVIDKLGMAVLLWKSFAEDAIPPKWERPHKKPQRIPGKVVVTAFISGWCPVGNANVEFAKKAAEELGDNIVYEEINTLDHTNLKEWGITDSVLVDGKNIVKGPPLTYEKVKKKIRRRLKKLK